MKEIILLLSALLLAGQLLAQPAISTQPTNQVVLNGSNVFFNVAVSGTGPFTYQWQFNGTNLPSNIISTVAGNGTKGYSGDGGLATSAALKTPSAVAFDASGNLFIADTGNNRIRKVDAFGIITTVAGNGTNGFSGDGAAATNAKMSGPSGVTLDGNGNLIITDNGNNFIRKVNTNGIITTIAGKTGSVSTGDGGFATNASLNSPSSVAVDANGNFFIAETVNNRIRKVDTNGIITTFAGKVGTGFSGDGGFATNATLNSPSGVALDANGNLLIADTGNNRIRKVDANGIITTAAGKGSFGYSGDGGKATNASVSSPSGVTVDNSNYLLIADSGNNRVRQVDASGIITNLAGNGSSTYSGDGGTATNAGLYPFGVAIDSSGNLCIADYINNRIRKVALNRFPALTLANVTTNNTGNYDVIITGSSGSVTSSIVTLTVVVPSAISAQPQSVVVTNGNPASLTLTAFGTAPLNYQWYFNGTTAVDGGTNATLNFSNATTNQSGNYFCIITNAYGSMTSSIVTLSVVLLPGITTQPTNQIVVIGGSVTFNVTASGTGPFTYQWQLNGTNLPHSSGGTNPPSYKPYNIVTVAGRGNDVGFGGDGGPAVSAQLFNPYGAAVDSFGNIFIADKVNNRIRKVDTNGIITTIAGVGPSAANGSYSGDGSAATNANLNFPIGVAVDGTGNLFIADSWNNRIRKVDTNGIITTVAGTNSSGFSGDGGAATSAKLNNPSTVFVDSSGNLLVADTDNNRVRKIDTNGIITSIAGTNGVGYSGDGGTATNAMLKGPDGVATDGFGNYYIADTTNNCIRKIDINGIITTFAGNGTAGYSGDGGAATNASLNQPYGVAVDGYGQVFFADYNNSRIRVVNDIGIITTLVGNGTAGYSDGGGIATNASLNHPAGLNFDNSGNLLIADQGNYRVRKVDFWGVPTLTLNKVSAPNLGNYSVVITSPFGSVTSSIVTVTVVNIIAQPYSVAVTNGGSANFTFKAATSDASPLSYQWYFNTVTPVDGGTNATLSIASVTTNKVGSYYCVIRDDYYSVTSRVVTLMIGLPPTITTQPANGIAISGQKTIFGVAISGIGPFTYQWQFDGTNLPNNIITTVAGNGTNGYSGDGASAVNASLRTPNGMAFDASGNLFIADSGNFRIREVYTNGIITTMAGGGVGNTGSGVGGPATNAVFDPPIYLAVDTAGNGSLYFSDTFDFEIVKVDTNGIITKFAGFGMAAFGGDGGLAINANFYDPNGLVADSIGNLFIADTYNHRIRKVDNNGIITTFAGTNTNGYSGDGGTATNASMSLPNGVALDTAGNLFIADYGSNNIRKVDINGIITTVAGNGTNGYSGDGGLATSASLSAPRDVSVDAAGNLFIADFGNNRIRKVDVSGIITTVAGNGVSGYSGDSGLATNASLSSPTSVKLDAAGSLFIADNLNSVIRKVSLGGSPALALQNPTTNNAGNYTVVITSPFGSVTSSVAALTIILPPQNFTAGIGNNLGVQLQFSGTPGWPYVLQAATNLAPPVNWQPVITNLADTNGNWSFTDTNLIQYPQRFYRASP